MKILVPQGIGDSVWALFKVQAVAEAHADRYGPEIDIKVGCADVKNEIESRSVEFLERFQFVNSVEMVPINILKGGPIADKQGIYRYIDDGPIKNRKDIDFVMMPNRSLEQGIPLEKWLPEYKTNWDIFRDWDFTAKEVNWFEGLDLTAGRMVVFHMAAVAGNSLAAGHNRGPIWTPKQWVVLGNQLIKRYKVKIVLVGSEWDRNYFDCFIDPLVPQHMRRHWVPMIGETTAVQGLLLGKCARFIISYQSGITMVPHYLGVPTAMFWRAKGNSINPKVLISFDEKMATAWVKPADRTNGKFMPLIYGRQSVPDILSEIKRRKW